MCVCVVMMDEWTAENNRISMHYIHAWKYHHKTHYAVQLIYGNTEMGKLKAIKNQHLNGKQNKQ